jgi:hypothetical protein
VEGHAEGEEELMMHSLSELIKRAEDPQFTEAQATELVEENVADLVQFCHYTRAQAYSMVLKNIGYFAVYYDETLAQRVFALYHTRHPVFGLTRPAPDEAYRISMEHNRKLFSHD